MSTGSAYVEQEAIGCDKVTDINHEVVVARSNWPEFT